ncbi:cell division ATP-binding protein FtsE [Haliovirga abyssi]|uniref:Cell division ATP-binding protein FtsE n=1 Tax=Haliovirga abyssi TaxID=2996794 RepID=A0AAU9DV89_9FUSO|nr:ATP-binding cassette domain-containing protein [Haliovirga abyssi]BDU50041.1 cell division ATP-binding protein FtsE [Haliovirga abyssi]
MIEFINVTKRKTKGRRIILNNINFKINEGDFVYLVGESGSGKTTLLEMIYGKSIANNGTIIINGKKISELKSKELQKLRKNIGIIFQDMKLFEKKSVKKNIEYRLKITNDYSEEEINDRIDGILDFLKLKDKKYEIVNELSKGEKQRVAIARGLVTNPDIILCDEITANIDYDNSLNIMKILYAMQKQRGCTIIFSTHNKNIIKDFPNRVIEIKQGEINNED